jgi:hypothetical protein
MNFALKKAKGEVPERERRFYKEPLVRRFFSVPKFV